MKKSVILLIAIVYIASIFIVGLMGIQMKVYDKIVYVEEIKYVPLGQLNEEKSTAEKEYYENSRYQLERLTYGEDGKLKQIRIVQKYEEGISFELAFKVLPDNATIADGFNKQLFKYEWDASKKYIENEETGESSGTVIYSVNSDGNAVVKFMEEDEFKFTVKPDDGVAKVSVEVVIVVVP